MSSDQRKWLVDVVAVIISLCALGVSIRTDYVVRAYHNDSEKANLIRQTYSDFRAITDLVTANWELMYIGSLPDQYETVRNIVEKRLRCADEKKRTEILLKERAIASSLFTMYEHSYFQWDNAKTYGDQERERFLRSVLDYFSNKLLRNPRLMWYWSADGANLRSQSESETIKYYEKTVLGDSNPVSWRPDAIGVFRSEANNNKGGRCFGTN